MLKKNSLQYGGPQNEAFNQLKHCKITALVLALPDITEPFVLETGASGNGIEAMLMQKRKAIGLFQ